MDFIKNLLMKDSAVTNAVGNISNSGPVTLGGTHFVTNYIKNFVIPSTKENIPKKEDADYIEEIAGNFKRHYVDSVFSKCNYFTTCTYADSETFDNLYIPMALEMHSSDGSILKNLQLEDILKYISKNLLLTGEPGSGRTTACRRLIHHWINKTNDYMKEFQLVIYLRLDDERVNETIVETIVERCQSLDLGLSHLDLLELLSRLKQSLLIILDGFDNAKVGVKGSVLKLLNCTHSVLEHYLKDATIVMTTSLSQAKCVCLHFNKHVHVAGLTKEGQLQHVEKYPLENRQKHRDMIESQQKWLHRCSPLILQMLFYLVRAKKEFSDSAQFWEQLLQGGEENTIWRGKFSEICLRNLINNQNFITLEDFRSAIPEDNNFLLTNGIFHIMTSEEGARLVQPVHNSLLPFLANNFLQEKWDKMENEELRRNMVTEFKIQSSDNDRKRISLFDSETEVVVIVELIANSISLMLKLSKDERGEVSSRNSRFLLSDVAIGERKKLSESSTYSTRIRLCSENAFDTECMANTCLSPLIDNAIEYLSLIANWNKRKVLFRMHSNKQEVLDIPLDLFQNLQTCEKIQYCGIDVACQHCNSSIQHPKKTVELNCKVTDIFQENRLCKSEMDTPKETFSYMLAKPSCASRFLGVFITLINVKNVIEFFTYLQMYFVFVNWDSALKQLQLPGEITNGNSISKQTTEFSYQCDVLMAISEGLIKKTSHCIRILREVLESEGETIGSFLLNFKMQLENFVNKVETIPIQDNPNSVRRCIAEIKSKFAMLSVLCNKINFDSKCYYFSTDIIEKLSVFASELNEMMENLTTINEERININILDRKTFEDSIGTIDANLEFQMNDLASKISGIESAIKISRTEYESDKSFVNSVSTVLIKLTGHFTETHSALTRDATMLYRSVKRFNEMSCSVDKRLNMQNGNLSSIKEDINSEMKFQHDILDSFMQEVKGIVTAKDICFEDKQREITEMVERMFETNSNENEDMTQCQNEPSKDFHSFGLVISELGSITCHTSEKTFPLTHLVENGHDTCEE